MEKIEMSLTGNSFPKGTKLVAEQGVFLDQTDSGNVSVDQLFIYLKFPNGIEIDLSSIEVGKDQIDIRSFEDPFQEDYTRSTSIRVSDVIEAMSEE